MRATEPRAPPVIPTLAIVLEGASSFHVIGIPAAGVTGPATAVAAATVSGVRTETPPCLRGIIFLVIGAQIGSTVTPDVIDAAMAWPISLAILTVTLIAIMLFVQISLRFFLAIAGLQPSCRLPPAT